MVDDLALLADHQKTRRILVQTMNKAGSGRTFTLSGLLSGQVAKQPVQKGSIGVTGSWMDDEGGGFVDHKKEFILIEDVEVHLLRSIFRWGRRGDVDGDDIRSADFVGRGLDPSIDGNQAFIQDFLDS